MLEGFELRIAEDDSDRKLLSDVEKFGWHVLQILPDKACPAFSFSVGLYYSYAHPELLVMGLPEEVAKEIINDAGTQIANERKFSAGERISDLVAGFDCTCVSVFVEHYQAYLGYGIWFYRSLKNPFPALQIVWPDKSGRFPWEPGFDRRLGQLQRVLGVPT